MPRKHPFHRLSFCMQTWSFLCFGNPESNRCYAELFLRIFVNRVSPSQSALLARGLLKPQRLASLCFQAGKQRNSNRNSVDLRGPAGKTK